MFMVFNMSVLLTWNFIALDRRRDKGTRDAKKIPAACGKFLCIFILYGSFSNIHGSKNY